jgi:uncharacterized protein
MAPYGLYESSVPAIQTGLESLVKILKKGEEYAKENNMDIKELLEGRLCDDMLPLPFQVHIATDFPAKMLWRVQQAERTVFENDLKTLDDLYARIAKTQEILKQADRETFEARKDEMITMDMGPGRTINLPCKAYIDSFILPNFYFHVTTAYGILRSKGVPLGKPDFIGSYVSPYMTSS